MYRIKEFAAMTGLPPSKIRFYEKHGLLAARREENGYRVFSPEDAFRSNAFRVLLQYGFTVEQAVAMLDAEQGAEDFKQSLIEQRTKLRREADLLRYRLAKLNSAIELVSTGDQAAFTLVAAPDQLYVSASVGRDFSISTHHERDLALLYDLLSVTSCARIISKRDFDAPGDTVEPSYVIALPESEEHRLKGVDIAHVERLRLGKCVRFRRRVTREESVRKETFADLFAYLDEHDLSLRGDLILFPSFLNLDGNGSDIETLFVPVRQGEADANARNERAGNAL
ncbi:MerR family transcriptional regulator [Gordonibacter sp. An230]|uniref:MerR family transcriptional regulator n=1 Tax=Gordonibacter sp. An230 TaxID=1965592 RepID=UPI000B37BB00|nr:MerR family transcriptional regulator [Gordonibacter sp. An230]OUO92489.1 MerR family transcriptional regulator [Gordonibacter sp. An230]